MLLFEHNFRHNAASTILDKIKWNSKPPSPPNQGWSRAKGKNAPFSHPWFGGRGGLGFPFILSKIVGEHALASPPPSLQSLLSTSVPVRVFRWAYTDVITKFYRMDSFPFFSVDNSGAPVQRKFPPKYIETLFSLSRVLLGLRKCIRSGATKRLTLPFGGIYTSY